MGRSVIYAIIAGFVYLASILSSCFGQQVQADQFGNIVLTEVPGAQETRTAVNATAQVEAYATAAQYYVNVTLTAVAVPTITPFPPHTPPTEYIVGEDEALWSIVANTYPLGGCNVEQVAAYNHLTNPDVLAIGQILYLPSDCDDL